MNMFSKRVTAIALTFTVLTGLLSGTGTLSNVSAATPVNIGPQDPKEVEQFADEFFSRPEIKDSMAGAAFVVVKLHENYTEHSNSWIAREVNLAATTIRIVTGARCRLIRTPNGDLNRRVTTLFVTVSEWLRKASLSIDLCVKRRRHDSISRELFKRNCTDSRCSCVLYAISNSISEKIMYNREVLYS